MNELYIRLMAPIVPETTAALLQAVDQALGHGMERLHLLISSPGGSVFHGLSLYNFLRGMPIETYTYNFGSVDSIGVVVYSAGVRRFCVPHARFLLHGVRSNFAGNASLDEQGLEETLKGLRIDQQNIARVIADTAGKSLAEVEGDIHRRITLNPQEARDYGLVHEIRSALFPPGAQMFTISEGGAQPG